MSVSLAVAENEPEFADPALAGEWAAVLPDMLAAEQIAPWCSYAVRRDGALVGLGGFKGPPDDTGRVEIAYLTLRPYEGQRVATEVVAALLDSARQEGVAGILAHTLPETNASTKALTRNGFRCAGEVIDPDDGPVWRWEAPALA